MNNSDILYECILCGKVFKSKRKHKCHLGKVADYGEWRAVRECCITGCHNLITAYINEFLCLRHQNAFDRFHSDND